MSAEEALRKSDRNMMKIAAIFCLTVLESVAVLRGIDGAYFLPVVAAIAGLAGYEFGKK